MDGGVKTASLPAAFMEIPRFVFFWRKHVSRLVAKEAGGGGGGGAGGGDEEERVEGVHSLGGGGGGRRRLYS